MLHFVLVLTVRLQLSYCEFGCSLVLF
uniref:Uncharacterized protein n=1 Tax=Anguilla anguilla TaxID=7936 RepID=A0A0E9VLN5_ANGAN